MARVAEAAVLGKRDLVQVGAVRPRPDPSVDQGAGDRTGRRGAPDAALSRPGCLSGDGGWLRAGDGARSAARRCAWRPPTLRALAATAGEPGSAGGPRAGRGQPPRLAACRHEARRPDLAAPTHQPRPGRPRPDVDSVVRSRLTQR